MGAGSSFFKQSMTMTEGRKDGSGNGEDTWCGRHCRQAAEGTPCASPSGVRAQAWGQDVVPFATSGLERGVCALGFGGRSAMLCDPRDRLGKVLGVTGNAFKAQENGRELLMAGKLH